jgi:hypothetical protein
MMRRGGAGLALLLAMTAALALALIAGPSRVARADNPVAQCTATEILATNDKKGVDPRLDSFKGRFGRPPFAYFDSFRQIGQVSVAAPHHKAASARLVYGALTLLFKDKLVAAGGKPRLRFGIDVDDAKGSRTVSTTAVFDNGDTLFPTAGLAFQGGTYILAVTCAAP